MASKTVTRAQNAILGDRLLDLVAAGHSVAAAARTLEINERRAQRLYHSELQRVFEENAGLRQELLGKELRTLDLLQRKMMQKALSGDARSAEIVLSIMDRRSKYLGLDQAAKVQVEVSRVDDALADIVQIIDGSMAATELDRVRALPEAG